MAVRDGDPAAVAELSQVPALTEELDEIAWDAEEQAEAGVLPEQACLAVFARARAAASEGFALEPDALHAALESVDEAQAAFADLEAVRAAVAAAIANQSSPIALMTLRPALRANRCHAQVTRRGARAVRR